jgi:4'-phosphopantetheinyl transferase
MSDPGLSSRTASAAAEGAADVFVFWTVVPTDPAISEILPRLDPTERMTAGRFHFAEDRHAYAVAHCLLYHALDRVGGDHPWRFRRMPGGKPILDGDDLPALQFSLAHSRTLGAVAIGRAGPLGVDVETVAPTRSREDVVGLAFAPAEQALLRPLAGTRWLETFYTLWTLKEAAIKATGQGLSADLPAFAFALDPPRLRTPGPDGSQPHEWYFHSAPIADCRLAAALQAPPGLPIVFHLSEVSIAELRPVSA